MNREEFNKLLCGIYDKLKRMAKSYAIRFNKREEWEDLLQESVLKMLQYYDKFDPTKGKFEVWTAVIIINTIKTHDDRSAWIDNRIAAYYEYMEKSSREETPEDHANISILIDNMNEETRLYAAGYQLKEISEIRNIHINTAHNRINRCTDNLNKRLGLMRKRYPRTRTISKKPFKKYL